jgi:hypothetical protein
MFGSNAQAAAEAHVSYVATPVATQVADAGIVTDTKAVEPSSADAKNPIFITGRAHAAVRIANIESPPTKSPRLHLV